MSKKNAVMMKIFIPQSTILEIRDEGNRRIKRELKIKNIKISDEDFFKSDYFQDKENVRNAFVNVIALPIKVATKGFSPVQIRNYNLLIDSLVTQICDEEKEEIILTSDEWKLIKPYWEHDGDKVFNTAVLDGVVLEYFHDKIFPEAKEITKEELELKETKAEPEVR